METAEGWADIPTPHDAGPQTGVAEHRIWSRAACGEFRARADASNFGGPAVQRAATRTQDRAPTGAR
eukprot:4694557-Pyramimonas_sp.AAC.1